MIDISFGGIVFKKIDGVEHVLMTRRPLADGWDFPKGHADEGERHIHAALREIKEETGYGSILLYSHRAFHTEYSYLEDGVQVDKQVYYFVGRHRGDETPKPKHDDSEKEKGMVAEWIAVDRG